jgi:hypothetical protein
MVKGNADLLGATGLIPRGSAAVEKSIVFANWGIKTDAVK